MCRNPNHPAKGSTIVIEPLRSLEDVAKVCKVLKDQPRNLALFALGVSSNLRASDLLKLRANDIDWQKCEIILREKKTSKRRHIAIPPNVMSYLSAIRGADDAYLFGNSRTGEQMTVEALNALVKKWTFRAGIPGHFGSHTLRKTWAFCQYRIFKMDLADVSEQLNHSNMNTTYRYLGIMPAKIRAMYMNEICPAI